jgi:parvulin-like peptidyl-prolyl isomerase
MGRSLAARALLPWTILIVLMVGAAVALGPRGALSEEVVARVNGEPVSRGEWERMVADPVTRHQLQRELGVKEPGRNELGRLALRKLINRRLILQEASRRGFTVTEQDLSRATVAVRGRFKDLKAFGTWLRSEDLNDRSLQEVLRGQLLAARVLATLVEDVHLTEEQVQEYYEAHPDQLKIPEEVRLRIIAVKDKAVAEEILAAAQNGEDFDRLVRERPTGSGPTHDLDMGPVSPESLAQPLREAVGALKSGETGGPVPMSANFLVVRLEERRLARVKSATEARPEIERHLLTEKRQAVVHGWLTAQEAKSKIEVFLPILDSSRAVNHPDQ